MCQQFMLVYKGEGKGAINIRLSPATWVSLLNNKSGSKPWVLDQKA